MQFHIGTSGSGFVRLWRRGPGVSWCPARARKTFAELAGDVVTWTIGPIRFRFLVRQRERGAMRDPRRRPV